MENKENQIIMNKCEPDNFFFSINRNDTIFTLTRNYSFYKENVSNIVSKIVIIKEANDINLQDFSKKLDLMRIEKLNIYCINYNSESNIINYTIVNKGCIINYAEMNPKNFIKLINLENNKFLDYNKHTLYIVKSGNYLEIKNLFTIINNCQINLVRGGSQKAHVLSPLDFRLSSYLMAMFNFDYKYIMYLNTFNDLDKNRYLS